jgi:hypothetical protein
MLNNAELWDIFTKKQKEVFGSALLLIALETRGLILGQCLKVVFVKSGDYDKQTDSSFCNGFMAFSCGHFGYTMPA